MHGSTESKPESSTPVAGEAAPKTEQPFKDTQELVKKKKSNEGPCGLPKNCTIL